MQTYYEITIFWEVIQFNLVARVFEEPTLSIRAEASQVNYLSTSKLEAVATPNISTYLPKYMASHTRSLQFLQNNGTYILKYMASHSRSMWFLQNTGNYLLKYMTSHTRSLWFLQTLVPTY
jgi:hypothetical protein